MKMLRTSRGATMWKHVSTQLSHCQKLQPLTALVSHEWLVLLLLKPFWQIQKYWDTNALILITRRMCHWDAEIHFYGHEGQKTAIAQGPRYLLCHFCFVFLRQKACIVRLCHQASSQVQSHPGALTMIRAKQDTGICPSMRHLQCGLQGVTETELRENPDPLSSGWFEKPSVIVQLFLFRNRLQCLHVYGDLLPKVHHTTPIKLKWVTWECWKVEKQINRRFAILTFSKHTIFLLKNNRIVVVINHLQLSVKENRRIWLEKHFRLWK